jgi:hypothetical protein
MYHLQNFQESLGKYPGIELEKEDNPNATIGPVSGRGANYSPPTTSNLKGVLPINLFEQTVFSIGYISVRNNELPEKLAWVLIVRNRIFSTQIKSSIGSPHPNLFFR